MAPRVSYSHLSSRESGNAPMLMCVLKSSSKVTTLGVSEMVPPNWGNTGIFI